MSSQVLVWLLMELNGDFLLCRRKEERQPFAGQWVLPGDSMRASESASETLSRVAANELGIRLSSEEFVDTFFLQDEANDYAVNVFRPLGIEGRPRYREGGPYAEARWVKSSDVSALRPCPQQIRDLLAGKRHWQDAAAPANE